MLPQPMLRLLLADEPGTGKTIIAGLYLREMQKLGFVNRALVVVPAGLVNKWQTDFARFFGGELRRITNDTIQQHGLEARHDMWIVSLELAAVNRSVLDAIRPDRAGWDIVVFDEAHRMTPTAESFHQVGRLLAKNTPRALLMTATPHRGSEWLFRHLLHLVDPAVFPDPGDDQRANLRPIRPGPIHFLRRMKESLRDYDGVTPLFKGREAKNFSVPLNLTEHPYYQEAQKLVEDFFPAPAIALAQQVYGKRAASSLYALAETLKRRSLHMGAESPVEAAHRVDPDDIDDAAREEAEVIAQISRSAREEKKAISELLSRLEPDLHTPSLKVSKWKVLSDDCLAVNNIRPGSSEQAVIFTEFTDTANWIVQRLENDGFSARRYSGLDHPVARDEIRDDFMAGKFQIIVSTDAGNEGIDLQSAHVLINYDIPWSLVRLEQRMGRIHRVGQTRDVRLYNLIAQGTREGDTLHTLLTNFVNAANQLSGQMFDSLSLVAQLAGLDEAGLTQALADTFSHDPIKQMNALKAVEKITTARLVVTAREARKTEAALASTVNFNEAIQRLNQDTLSRINPAIIAEFLNRLASANLITVGKTAAGDGILRVGRQAGALPEALGSKSEAVIATSGKALTDARKTGASVAHVIPLGPGEPAFADVVAYTMNALSPDLFRGGLVTDQTVVTDYDLFVFEGVLVEGDGQRTSPWRCLIRVDDVGAREVSWTTLANLVPATGIAGEFHPARVDDAQTWAAHVAGKQEAMRRDAIRGWLERAGKELRKLPERISEGEKGDERRRLRKELEEMVEARLVQLRGMGSVTIHDIHQVTAVKVKAVGVPPDPKETDSEIIAVTKVCDHLTSAGFQVGDVQQEHVGYDLHAIRGAEQRCVEVKGVWHAATSDGIRLIGNEILVATQQRRDYWLYVVEQCADGKGTLFGSFQDPVSTFEGLIKQEAVFRVPGSALKAARDKAAAT
jgi:superfamily II DNA or RNA helicase